jgi:hypothetical protein
MISHDKYLADRAAEYSANATETRTPCRFCKLRHAPTLTTCPLRVPPPDTDPSH